MENEANARKIWDYWYPLVYGYFYKRVNNRPDVEEMTSTTITSLILKSDVLNPQGYVWQTAKNQLVLYISKKAKQPNILQINEQVDTTFQKLDNHTDTESEKIVSKNYTQFLTKLMECIENSLSEEEIKITKMSIIEEQNSSQISRLLELKAATVRQKLKRAIYKLKQKCVDIWHELKPE